MRISAMRLRFPLSAFIFLLLQHAPIDADAQAESHLDADIDVTMKGKSDEFLALCQASHSPCGVEKNTCSIAGAAGSRPRKMKLRGALDQAISRHPGHKWTVSGGVINIEPTVRTGPDLLSKRLDKVSFHSVSSKDAFSLVLKQAGIQTGGTAYSGPGPVYGTIDLELKNVTVRDALNAIALADGQIAWWACPEKPEQSRLGFNVSTWRKFDPKKKGSGLNR